MDRRSFLQLLGAGAVGASSGLMVPLFSGKDSGLWTPEHTSLTSHHLVLVPRKGDPKARFQRLPMVGGVHISKLYWGTEPTDMRKNWPVVGGHTLRLLDADPGVDEVPDVRVVARDEEDLNLVFYRAAMNMRNAFAERTTRMFAELPEWERRSSRLVTLVDVPIFAGALDTYERGFHVSIGYACHVVPLVAQKWSHGRRVDDPEAEDDLRGWEVYSETGEYPIEIPSDIDLERLQSFDREIIERKRRPILLASKG